MKHNFTFKIEKKDNLILKMKLDYNLLNMFNNYEKTSATF